MLFFAGFLAFLWSAHAENTSLFRLILDIFRKNQKKSAQVFVTDPNSFRWDQYWNSYLYQTVLKPTLHTTQHNKKTVGVMMANFESRKMNFESMEDRRLMAGSIDLDGGVLEIQGTNGDDVVVVTQLHRLDLVRVTIETDGEQQIEFFNLDDVDSIEFYGGNGDDSFSNSYTNISATAYGGYGNDTLIGGNKNDYFYGQDGNDRIYGYGGDDVLVGGSGNDIMRGGLGADYMYGQSGNDDLNGESGNDRISGGSGHDYLYGGTGNDRLYGDSGNDRLYGQSGDDDLWGGSGTDRFYGGSGFDRANDWFFEYNNSVEDLI